MMVIALCALIIDNTQAFLGSSANAIESLIYEIDAIKLKLFNKKLRLDIKNWIIAAQEI
jgi:hypothetical protein